MTLRTYHGVATRSLHELDEAGDVGRIQLHIGVDEGDQVTCALINPQTQCEAFAHVHRVMEDPHIWGLHTPGLANGLIRVAVRYDHNLVGRVEFVELVEKACDVLIDALALAKRGDHDGDLDWDR